MAVTKTVEPPAINEAIRQGVTLLGENKVQEYLDKREQYLPATVHFIGNLQTNKVKYIIDKVAMIQSVSSEKLALEIEKQAAKHIGDAGAAGSEYRTRGNQRWLFP